MSRKAGRPKQTECWKAEKTSWGATFRCVYCAYILALLYVLDRATNRILRGYTKNLFLEALFAPTLRRVVLPLFWVLDTFSHCVDFVNVLWFYSCLAADNCQLNGRLGSGCPQVWHRALSSKKATKEPQNAMHKVILGWQYAVYLLFMTYAVQTEGPRDLQGQKGCAVCRGIVCVRREKFKVQ